MKNILWWASVIFVAAGLGGGCVESSPCETLPITQVGGCDKYGRCGVKYNDGTFGKVRYPVIGRAVEVCR